MHTSILASIPRYLGALTSPCHLPTSVTNLSGQPVDPVTTNHCNPSTISSWGTPLSEQDVPSLQLTFPGDPAPAFPLPSLPSDPSLPNRHPMVRYCKQSLVHTLNFLAPFLSLYHKFNHTFYTLLCLVSLPNVMFLRFLPSAEYSSGLFPFIPLQHSKVGGS